MRLFIISGATATGKSALAQALAKLTNAHIVSVDSMKLYRGMDIGTDKPPRHILKRIPHHMLNVSEPSENYDVAKFVKNTLSVIETLKKKRTPFLLEGGTPLYLKALTEGLFEGVPADYALRERLHAEARRDGVEALFRRLEKVDPQTARRIHRNDIKRIVRALEVFETTGRPLSALQTQFGKVRNPYFLLVLWRGREELRERIRLRVEEMFGKGFVEEVKTLVEKGLGLTASQAAGYAEVAAYLRGECTIEEAKRRTEVRHRQLARRQMTWLKRFKYACHICLRGEPVYGKLAEEVLRLFGSGTSLLPQPLK